VPRLVALDLPGGPAFVGALQAAWDAGDAVLPLDPRLPEPATRRILDHLRPSVIVGETGRTHLDGGMPTEDGDALVLATSGTTGDPKGVVLTTTALEASARATSTALAVDPARDRWVACLPLSHVGGLSVLVRALLTGTPYRLHPRFVPTDVEREAAEGATLVSLVATALGRTDVSGFRAVLLGGAAPPSGLPANVVTTYGATETGSGIVYDGRPLPGVEVRIGDGVTGASGASGEILVRGPMLLRCYRDGSDPKTGDGWFPTGDGGGIMPDGTLRVDGRLADVIVTGAEKVWPAAVETVLARHPGVAEVAVWKRPDAEWGERVVAWVVPADPASPPILGELRALAAETLAPWAAPKELVVTDRLPRTAIGKVQRRQLR
jgi:O-succinylbenzoic acid--CoA ligase